MKKLRMIPVLVLWCVLAGCVQPEHRGIGNLKPLLTRTMVLNGVRRTRPDVGVPGRIDHFAYDPDTQRLFVAALENGSLEVLDLGTGQRVQSIGGLKLPQGVAVIPTEDLVAVACGGDGMLRRFDLRSLRPLAPLEVGPDADNVRYDARTGTVLVCYGEDKTGGIAVFDAHTWTRLRDYRFDSHPESFQVAPDGDRMLVNLPKGVRATKDGTVAIIDRASGRTEAVIPLPRRARNFPMAFDAVHERLFIATRLPARLIVIDTRRNAIVTEAPCTDDSDDLSYDAQSQCVLVIGGGFRPDLQTPESRSASSPPGEMGGLDVFSVAPGGQLTRLSTTPTAPHARTGLFVPSRRAIYIAMPFQGERETEIQEYRLE